MKTHGLNLKKISHKDIHIVAHDLNNLLNNVINAIDLLKDKVEDHKSSKDLIKHIEKNTILASEIVQQISHTDGIVTSRKTEINLFEIAQDIIEIFKEKSEKPIDIELDCADNYYPIWGNRIELKRVVLNLVTNAQEAIEINPKVKIKIEYLKKDSELIKISIIDNGKGIKKNILAKIFEEGFSTKHNNAKRGLGLSIVQNIVQMHSGSIEVKSTEDIGTSFELSFPYHSNDIDYRAFEKKKVLIAEDDEFQREVLKDLLTTMKINVFTASNGIEALDMFISTKPDLLFIDETMPGLTGTECTEKIREFDKLSQIVLVTGSNIDEKYFRNKVSKVLTKPYNFDMIRSALKELL